jgi:hypothetical protein
MPFTSDDFKKLGYLPQPDGSFAHPSVYATKSNQPKNPVPESPRPIAKLEHPPCHDPLETGPAKIRNRQKFLVRVTSIRTRLLDEDNLCEKYHVDLCRYAGIISGDEAGTAKIETSQRKAKKGEAEHTLIEIELI